MQYNFYLKIKIYKMFKWVPFKLQVISKNLTKWSIVPNLVKCKL